MPKRTILAIFRILLPCLLVLMASAAMATQEVPVLSLNIPTIQLTNIVVVNEAGDVRTIDVPWLSEYITGVYSYAVGIAGTLAGIMMVIGGFQYLTAGGDANRVKAAKQRITDAVIGAALVLGAFMILSTLNPELVSNPALRVKTVKRVPFVKNETPASEIDSSGGAALPTGPTGPLTPTTIGHFAQCGATGAGTSYTARDGRCVTQPNGTRYTLCTSGCGIASATMVIGSLTGRDMNQLAPELAQVASTSGCRPCNGDCSDCQGTDENCLMRQMGRYGLQGSSITGRDRILSELQAGHPIVALYRTSVFTGGGHYIVLSAVNPDGTIRVLDPGKNQSPYNYNCDQVHRSDPNATCPVSSDHMPPSLIFDHGLSGTWLIRPQ